MGFPSMKKRHRMWVERGDGRLALARWGEPGPGKPPALLVHGTGFVAEVWDEVATALASRYCVYALDRRGHGASCKPAIDRYHFKDFARDVCAVIQALDLWGVFAIGHSAGATDLLLAAGLLPKRFERLFVMEPTVMDPGLQRTGAELSDQARAYIESVLRRRAEFDSAASALQRLRAAPAFAKWSEAALRAYVRNGFEVQPDGRVRLRCTPQIEAAMLRPIFEATQLIYAGDKRGNPFLWLSRIDCPVRVAIAEASGPMYKEMASRAVDLIPEASQWIFPGVGHCVAQEAPALLLQAIEAFEARAG
jgi:pimeloyl-ACP methyl ester carboxylesterase